MVNVEGTKSRCMRSDAGAYASYETACGTAHYHDLTCGGWMPAFVSKRTNNKGRPIRSHLEWEEMALDYAGQSLYVRPKLAKELGVSEKSIADLGVGRCDFLKAWTTPERDGSGNAIGISLRFGDGAKSMRKGSKRGLLIPEGWDQQATIYLPEGMSCTAAAITMGLGAVGRSQNRGQAEMLAELMQHYTGRIVVCGENDQKEDGSCPGIEGAEATAQQLADCLGRSVFVGYPPPGIKDIRELLASGLGTIEDSYEQKEFTTEVEPYVEPEGDVITVDAYRERLAEIVHGEQWGLVRAPTGVGKSFQTQERLRGENKGGIGTNNHINCREEEEALEDIGAVAYPELNKDTCGNIEEAGKVLATGLDVGAVLCFGNCPLAEACAYRAKLEKAQKAKHVIATHDRIRKSPRTMRGWFAIHEEYTPLRAEFDVDDVRTTRDVLRQVEKRLFAKAERGNLSAEELEFVQQALKLCDRMIDAYFGTEETIIHACDTFVEAPRFWQQRVYQACRGLKPNGAALRAIFELTQGRAKQWSVIVHKEQTKKKRTHTVKEIVVDWDLPLLDRPMLFDATGDAELISAWAGREIEDITPEGRLAFAQEVRQIPVNITRCGERRKKGWEGTSPATAIAYLRSIVEEGGYQRVGVITHSDIVENLEDHIEPQLRSRVELVGYFGRGDERASNAWIEKCDTIVILGTYRPNQMEVRRHLVRLGKLEAARVIPNWVDLKWNGKDAEGNLWQIQTKKYDHPDWHRVHQYLVRSAMLQSVGRGRPYLEEGIPCVVVSCEPLGLPIDIETKARTLTPSELKLAKLAHKVGDAELRTAEIVGSSGGSRSKVSAALKTSVHWEQAGYGSWKTKSVSCPKGKRDSSRCEAKCPDFPIRITKGKRDIPPRGTDSTPESEIHVPVELLEQFEERAAIMEFDGGLRRDEAESQAAALLGIKRRPAILAGSLVTQPMAVA